MNRDLQRIGGIAAVIEALAYIIGFTVLIVFLTPENADKLDSIQKLAFLLDHQEILQVWNLIIYVLFGVFLVVLTIALHDRLKDKSPAIMQTATAFGLIWSCMVIASGMIANVGLAGVKSIYDKDAQQATAVWQAIDAIQNGLGGGVEVVGALWVLLISYVALKSKELPKGLNYVGVVVGIAGLLTVIPALGILGAVFGLSQIVWFLWLGVFMLSGDRLTRVGVS